MAARWGGAEGAAENAPEERTEAARPCQLSQCGGAEAPGGDGISEGYYV